MMSKGDKPADWLSSKEAEKALHVDPCKLMHLRLEGRLHFEKRRNAFVYSKKSVNKHRTDIERA